MGTTSGGPNPRAQSPQSSGRFAGLITSRRTWGVIVVLVVAFGVADARQPPGLQVGVRWALAGITWYQRTLSVRLPVFGVSCRFVPTCSRYAHAVIGEHGLWTGTRLALGRLARCGPWTPHGTMDPPPRRRTQVTSEAPPQTVPTRLAPPR